MASNSRLTSSGPPAASFSPLRASLSSLSASPSLSRAFSKLPKGREKEEGVVTPDNSFDILCRAPKLKLFPPTTPRLYSLGVRTQFSDFSGGMSLRASTTFFSPLLPLASSSASAISSRKILPVVLSQHTFAGTPLPVADIASHSLVSEQEARNTPVFLALIAMWLRMSMGDAVRTATTPSGISSNPPKPSDSSTIGAASKLSPCNSLKFSTRISPLASPESGLTTFQVLPPDAALIGFCSLLIIPESTNRGWPLTISSPKLRM
mmetsp:Transcript_4328/g.12724  ORF Transcript_4328/g.12724 Transcript_4328/m.12724 type:complete len:264 (-) Transcript_4328:1812-2603(-)